MRRRFGERGGERLEEVQKEGGARNGVRSWEAEFKDIWYLVSGIPGERNGSRNSDGLAASLCCREKE